jgi:hypothetical protein
MQGNHIGPTCATKYKRYALAQHKKMETRSTERARNTPRWHIGPQMQNAQNSWEQPNKS